MSEPPEFFAGAASGSSRKTLAWGQNQFEGTPRPSKIMVNYQTHMNTPDSRWANYELMYDCGAYSIFSPPKFNGQDRDEYPQSPREYLRFVRKHGAERHSWMDYVGEPEVRRARGWTIEDVHEKTTTAHIECANIYEDLGIDSEPTAVIQGWTPSDYKRHAQQLLDHGLITDRVGIGSLSGRATAEEVRNIITAVRRVLPDVEIHAFGLDKKAYIQPILDEIAATDTLAYTYRYKRPSGWKRWEYVLFRYLAHRAEWDSVISGEEYKQDKQPENETLETFV